MIEIKEILPDFFRVKLPLPQHSLKTVNSYIIRALPRSLIIDTGFNREECLQAMYEALHQLEINLHDADLFITHSHVDHAGLINGLVPLSSRIYISQTEAECLKYPNIWLDRVLVAKQHGFSHNDLNTIMDTLPARKYGTTNHNISSTPVSEGDIISIGHYNLRCLSTPGHSPGHMCLYEPINKILVSGDHILGDITPIIPCWSDADNPLGDYLYSLKKVYNIEIDLVLPGHRSEIRDCRKRISEVIRDHEQRLEEIMVILADNGSSTTIEVVSKMSWGKGLSGWETLPLLQKYYATVETLAHLRYLEEQPIIRRWQINGTIVFSRL